MWFILIPVGILSGSLINDKGNDKAPRRFWFISDKRNPCRSRGSLEALLATPSYTRGSRDLWSRTRVRDNSIASQFLVPGVVLAPLRGFPGFPTFRHSVPPLALGVFRSLESQFPHQKDLRIRHR
jgi:hypothetical protein